MSTVADMLSGGTFMPLAASVKRLRAKRAPDPYNPSRTVEDWGEPEELAMRGFISSSSSTETTDGARDETVSAAVLTVEGPSADIEPGDRIRTEPDDGRLWRVTGFPSRDASPFTGWAPTTEANLEEVVG